MDPPNTDLCRRRRHYFCAHVLPLPPATLGIFRFQIQTYTRKLLNLVNKRLVYDLCDSVQIDIYIGIGSMRLMLMPVAPRVLGRQLVRMPILRHQTNRGLQSFDSELASFFYFFCVSCPFHGRLGCPRTRPGKSIDMLLLTLASY
jgi:hypothetical protein